MESGNPRPRHVGKRTRGRWKFDVLPASAWEGKPGRTPDGVCWWNRTIQAGLPLAVELHCQRTGGSPRNPVPGVAPWHDHRFSSFWQRCSRWAFPLPRSHKPGHHRRDRQLSAKRPHAISPPPSSGGGGGGGSVSSGASGSSSGRRHGPIVPVDAAAVAHELGARSGRTDAAARIHIEWHRGRRARVVGFELWIEFRRIDDIEHQRRWIEQ